MSKSRNIARLIVDSSGAVDAANLTNAVPADGSITEAKLASNAVTSAKIAAGAVGESDLADGAVTNAKISAMAASKLTGQVPDANAPSGSVVQVVQYRFTTTWSSSSTSFVDVTGFEATITPSSTSSKILVTVALETFHPNTVQDEFRVLRNGSDPASISGGRLWFSSGYYGQGTTAGAATTFLDSPSSTSALTYKLQARNRHSNTFYIGYDWNADSPSGMHTLILMEIAG